MSVFLCVASYPDYEDPFDEGEAKAWDGPVAASCWCGQTERQEETDPIEEECHWTEMERQEKRLWNNTEWHICS